MVLKKQNYLLEVVHRLFLKQTSELASLHFIASPSTSLTFVTNDE